MVQEQDVHVLSAGNKIKFKPLSCICVTSDILEQIHTQHKLADEKEAEEDMGEEKGKRIR